MKVLLIDVDSKIPNLALMQISAGHKQQGDEVSLNNPNRPDRVYISCVFKKNKSQAYGIASYYPEAEVLLGGSGINYECLPEPMQKIYPDYSLYPMDYSLGFSTRGCIRRCPFCIVRDKEGEFQRWQHPREFYNPEFKKMVLLDNNLLADPDWFFEVTDWILEQGLKWSPNQGLDVRLLTPEIAARLKELKQFEPYHFAFDSVSDEPAVRHGIQLLKDAGINTKNNVSFFVLVGYNTTPGQDLYRCQVLRNLRASAFVMQYQKTRWTRRLAHWANRYQLFWSIELHEMEGYGQERFKGVEPHA